jgi:uncharacterized coiled-coil DUF342 family protein
MNCDRCGQRVNEVPECEHRFVGQAADDTLRCNYCGHNFGPVRELIEAKESMEQYGKDAQRVLDLRFQIATLTRERDEYATRLTNQIQQTVMTGLDLDKVMRERDEAVKERDDARQQWREAVDCLDTWKGIADAARARIAELERGMLAEGYIELRKNGTWEWRKV